MENTKHLVSFAYNSIQSSSAGLQEPGIEK